MKWVLITLAPIVLISGFFFGWRVYLLYLIAIVTAQLCELLWFKWTDKPLTWDLSAIVTAVLMTMNLPPTAPWYFPMIGAAFAIIVVKEFFGGLGYNFLNPALGGRALLVGLFFSEMFKISWPNPPFDRLSPDVVSQATPLARLNDQQSLTNHELVQAFLGNIGGRIGETCSILIILAAIVLLKKNIIQYHIPVIIVATVALGAWLFGGDTGLASWQTVLGHVLSGGLLLGAVFMATDYASSPANKLGECLFAFGIGLLILVFRFLGPTNEGVSYAILTMNCATPLIDRLLRRRVLGEPGNRIINAKLKR
ncbi:hypothetical protein RV04_GL001497 [Enterococcus hermanniensis]|uniref:Ion-translocating oxidoreductase complex subunit D n=2 Tax=Enterococcus hermanniensis TaxID=249189 RepID=A0A1L8TPS3_9ENTE|nr:hypothetical protein RV04_GL001497 [Enterococcus hermanniensis]